MRRLTSAFAVDVFDKRNARSDRLAEYLAIYVQNFGPEHRTSTSELLDFLSDPPPDRTIIYFGLTYADKPCGFATFMHYADGPIGIVDHLVIAPNHRGYGAFFSFCDLIAAYVESRRLPFDHLLAEVMLNERFQSSTIKPALLVRLMRLVGFRVAKTRYWAPDPMISTDIDACRAALLFASRPERDELPTREFIRLVELIFEVHYAGWYTRTMTPIEFGSYRIAARNALEKIRSGVGSERRIILNGMKNFDLTFVVDPNVRTPPSALIYMSLVAIPAVVGVAVAASQAIWVALGAGGFALAIIALFALHPRLRRPLMRVFQLKE